MEEVKVDTHAPSSDCIDLTGEECITSGLSSTSPAATNPQASEPQIKPGCSPSVGSEPHSGPQQCALTTILPKTKLTKEQRETQRIAREKEREELKAKALQKEKERAELKAKRDAENLRKEKEKADLKAKKEAENSRKEQEKREKQQKREQEINERRDKKEREELEKKERKEKRDAERKKREDEKRLKEESRKKKLEEKEQLKEEKLRKEEQAKMKFRSFFTKVDKPVKRATTSVHSILTPFSIKDSMRLATPSRVPLQDTSVFDSLLLSQDTSVNYLQTCKSQAGKTHGQPRGDGTPEPMEVDDDDSCQMWEEKCEQEKRKFKLIQFHKNYRPAYYGTWTKPRGIINPRNPFKMDNNMLDYTVDSDDEWEEEDPGESLSDSEQGDDKEVVEGEEEDDDDGFFVPHGYLSNDEGDNSDGEGGLGVEDSNDPQDRKNSQLAKAKAWEADFARKCQLLTKTVIGPTWPHSPASGSSPSDSLSCDETFLAQFAAVALVPLPIPHPMATKGEASSESSSDCNTVPGSGNTGDSMKQPVPEEAMPDLIRFVHKSPMGMTKTIHIFRAHWGAKVRGNSQDPVTDSKDVPMATNGLTPHKTNHSHSVIAATPKRSKTPTDFGSLGFASGISKRQLERKIQAIAVKEIRPPSVKALFYVHADVLHEYRVDEENMVALVSDSSSPLLIGADLVKTKAVASPDPYVKQKKKAAGNTQSLFLFLKSTKASPGSKGDNANGTALGKHQCTAKENGNDVIIVKVTSPGDKNLVENLVKEPPAKKLHLDGCRPEPLTNTGQPLNV